MTPEPPGAVPGASVSFPWLGSGALPLGRRDTAAIGLWAYMSLWGGNRIGPTSNSDDGLLRA